MPGEDIDAQQETFQTTQTNTGNTPEPELDAFLQNVYELVTLRPNRAHPDWAVIKSSRQKGYGSPVTCTLLGGKTLLRRWKLNHLSQLCGRCRKKREQLELLSLENSKAKSKFRMWHGCFGILFVFLETDIVLEQLA
jgi:hypothetical protein